MQDILAAIERALKEASECDLVAGLATDREKQAIFKKLADRHREIADELRAKLPKAS